MPKWDGIGEPIGEIAALKRQDMNEYAHELLVKVYRYVMPIMKKRNYRVHKLVEFLPKNECLLGVNVNHGQRISLRLRRTNNPKDFLPFESILGTMLHELCHNTFGPHNDDFFKLLGELTNQMEDMMARGFRGDEFVGSGNTLGGGIQWRGSMQIRAPKPYQRPKKIGRGRKLGGLGQEKDTTNKPLRELILEAVERRRQADMACKTANKISELTDDEQGEVIDLTGDSSDEEDKVATQLEKSETSYQENTGGIPDFGKKMQHKRQKIEPSANLSSIRTKERPAKRENSQSEIIYLLD